MIKSQNQQCTFDSTLNVNYNNKVNRTYEQLTDNEEILIKSVCCNEVKSYMSEKNFDYISSLMRNRNKLFQENPLDWIETVTQNMITEKKDPYLRVNEGVTDKLITHSDINGLTTEKQCNFVADSDQSKNSQDKNYQDESSQNENYNSIYNLLIGNSLKGIREYLERYLQNDGTTEYSFEALLKIMVHAVYKSILALFCMTLIIVTVTKVFFYVLRFMLDELISVLYTDDLGQAMKKFVIFTVYSLSIYICLNFILSFIFLPVVGMMINITVKLLII